MWWAEVVTGVADGTVRLFWEAGRGRGVCSAERTIDLLIPLPPRGPTHLLSFPPPCPLIGC